MLVSMAAWCADGDVFTAKTVEGVTMTFKVTSEANKECQVGDDEPNSASVAKSTAGAVTIPSNVNGYSVKSLGNKAFFECSNITTLIIPNSITWIGQYVFSGCTSLKEIEFPPSLKTIDRYGCYNSGVEKIVLPDGMTSIGNSAFRSCSNLQSVKIGKGTVTFGKNVFRDCSALSAITFDGTICRFNGEDAFRSCNSLISVTITDLGAWCKSWFYTVSSTPLYYANNLLLLKGNETAEIKNVVIPNDVTEISSYLFSGCNSLESVTIGDGVTSIGEYNQGIKGVTNVEIIPVSA